MILFCYELASWPTIGHDTENTQFTSIDNNNSILKDFFSKQTLIVAGAVLEIFNITTYTISPYISLVASNVVDHAFEPGHVKE